MNCNFLNCNNELVSSQQNKPQSTSLDSPLQIKLINFLGLKNFMIDKFIFKRKVSKYRIVNEDGISCLLTPYRYYPPEGYIFTTTILETPHKLSIPVAKLTPNNPKNNFTIIYAHGNASDMVDSLWFVEKMSRFIEAQFVVFDYSGYGASRSKLVGEEIIVQDLQTVISWLNKPLNEIILWGFSLGTFPVVFNAAKYPIKAIVLQAPIASISCIFHKELHKNIHFKEDYLANINYIDKVNSSVFIAHSSADQIIPFSHSKILFDKFVDSKGEDKIVFIQIAKIKHNSMNNYLTCDKQNALKRQLFSFLAQLPNSKPEGKQASVIDSYLLEVRKSIKEVELEQYCFNQNDYQIITNGQLEEEPTNGIVGSFKNCFCIKK